LTKESKPKSTPAITLRNELFLFFLLLEKCFNMLNYNEFVSDCFYHLSRKNLQNINISREEENTSLFGLFIV